MDPLSFLFWRFYYFFRDPVRKPPPGRVLLSPADGFLLYARRVTGGEVPSPIKQAFRSRSTSGPAPCPRRATAR
jgi:phosphatidylserine decarboxylase